MTPQIERSPHNYIRWREHSDKTYKTLTTATIINNNRLLNQEHFQGSLKKVMLCCFPILVTLGYFSGKQPQVRLYKSILQIRDSSIFFISYLSSILEMVCSALLGSAKFTDLKITLYLDGMLEDHSDRVLVTSALPLFKKRRRSPSPALQFP